MYILYMWYNSNLITLYPQPLYYICRVRWSLDGHGMMIMWLRETKPSVAILIKTKYQLNYLGRMGHSIFVKAVKAIQLLAKM